VDFLDADGLSSKDMAEIDSSQFERACPVIIGEEVQGLMVASGRI
jgi:hypothetical protein